jgi:surface carbohydrate biosynthesis protein (TIGR04326 family)
MIAKNLLIVDNCEGKVFDQYVGDNLNESEWEILTLGATETLYFGRNKAKLQQQLANYSFIDLTEYYLKAQELTKEYCLRLKFEFPKKKIWKGKTLFDLLSFKEFNLWWFTTFSEMGTFRIKFIDQIYFLSLIQLVISSREKYDNICLDIKDCPLNSILTDYFRKENMNVFTTRHYSNIRNTLTRRFPLLWWIISVTSFLSLQLVKTAILKLFNIGFNPDSKNFYLFFSFYPLLWKNKEEKNIRNAIYNDLPEQLSEVAPSYHAVFITNIGELWKQRKSIHDVFQNGKIIPVERFITLKNYWFLLSIKLVKLIFNYSFFVSKKIKEFYNGYDITKLVVGTFNSSLGDHELFRDVLIYFALTNIFRKYDVRGIIHASEFQCYEKAIWYAAKNKCKVFALQHSAIGKNWLNYYFCPDEIPLYLGDKRPSWNMPLPDLYLTSGVYPYEVIVQNKIPENMLRLCGAVRYDKLASYIQHKPSKIELRKKYNIQNKMKVLLVFSGVNREESINMISNISFALQEIDAGILVLFKSHPLRIIDEEFKKIMRTNNVRVPFDTIPVNANYFEYITLADVTCFCNSTIGIESIALGTHAVSFDNIHSMVSFDMIEVGDAVFHVKNPCELRQALDKILRGDEILKMVENLWSDAIYKTFYSLDGKSHKRFIECLKN